MAGKIIVLPESLSSKIAAGEVVERPASILKELLENAVDAGATDVTIELEKGGCGSIKVVDNGEGIESIDVPRAFERFATSKIYQFDDIYKVRSYGFRGEALPSIAAVSRVEMVTRKQPALSGTRVIIEAGQVKTVTDTGCPVGTSILVSHIFDPVPVRKKFLKKEMTEQGYCMDVMTRIALSRPEIRMRVVAHGREILNIPAARDISERVSLVLGTDFMDHMVSVKGVKGSITLTGLASKPEYSRSGAKQLYYYVNKRFVRDYLLNHAVMTAYRRLIEAKRYPAVIMFVDFPPEDVDVNVHPAKMEVRFRNPKEVYDSIVETLATALANIAPVSSGERGPMMPDGYSERVREALKRYTISSGSEKLFFNKGVRDSVMPEPLTGKDQEKDVTQLHRLSEESHGEQEISCERLNFADLEYIGQIAGTYLAFSSPAGMTLIDQHAAHERILFDKLKKGSSAPGEKVISQRLLMSELVSLAHGEYDTLMEYAKIFEDAGIEVEPFGEKTVIVKSVPAMLSHSEPKELFFEILEEFSKTERSLGLEERKEKMFALLACKGAVKANQKLSESEVAMLCRDLDATTFSSTCPHGRPVFISFTIRDMERMFKR
ncbi:MAG: DNA mismatch repair endonuclease MutL [Deltaproteobacteria bacterium]|nr:DNA mismatch repair endonuclease MutL [Deltaproteobacteria bacterium]